MYRETTAYQVTTSGFPNSNLGAPPHQNFLCKQTVSSVVCTVYGSCHDGEGRPGESQREGNTQSLCPFIYEQIV